MANYAKIRINFLSNPTNTSDSLVFDMTINGNINSISEIPVDIRFFPNSFEIGNTLSESVINYGNAIRADYVQGAVIALPIVFSEIGENYIEYTTNIYNVAFSENSTPDWVDSIIITAEVTPEPQFSIGDITLSEASSIPCTNVRYDFTLENYDLSDFPVEIEVNGITVRTAADDTDLWFENVRYTQPQQTLTVVSDNGPTDSILIPRLSKYTLNDINVQESFTGATITIIAIIDTVGEQGLNLTYSLDGTNYRASNIFYGILPGNYTAYVRDNYGCVQTDTFTVTGVTVDKPDPIFIIEDANPIKFYESTDFSACGEIPNFNNSPILDQYYFNIQKKNYEQLVQLCDNNYIQIKSNYDNIEVDIIDCDDNVVLEPTVSLVKQNILLQDKRDCLLKSGETGKTNIYFISGNIYEPGTTTIIDEYNITGGQLPQFASDGNIESGIKIEIASTTLNGLFIVESSVYDSEIQGWALQINAVFTGVTGENAISQASYNDEDYNIHEFNIDWSALEEGYYKINVTATDPDPRYNNVLWPSEIIDLKEYHKSTIITYTNPTSISQIDYSNGITFSLRVPARFIKDRDGGEIDSFVSDDNARKQLKGTVVDEIQLETDLIPQYLRKKISIASIHKTLTINGQSASLVEKGEQEDKFSDRNPFYYYNAWYQVGEAIEIGDSSGIISDTGRVLGVDASVLGIG